MRYHPLGIHLPNGPMDVDRWIDLVGDGCYTLLHFQAGEIGRIRQRTAGALVLVRFYLPDWFSTDPRAWARQCRDAYAGFKHLTRHVTWANEQNLGHESGNKVGSWPGRNAVRWDYEHINAWNLEWLDEWARLPDTGDAVLHYPACASGHSDDQDDWGFVGLDICRPGIDRCHVLDRHIYWSVDRPIDDLHHGVRRLELTERLFPGKPLFVKESGNFAVTDHRSPAQYQQAFYAFQGRPHCYGWTPFIAADPTGQHQQNDMSRNPAIFDWLRDTTRVYRDEPAWSAGPSAPTPPPSRTYTIGAGFQRLVPFLGEPVEDEDYRRAGTPTETSIAVYENGRASWDPRSNCTVGVRTSDGAIFTDYGNRGDGRVYRIA